MVLEKNINLFDKSMEKIFEKVEKQTSQFNSFVF